jgi:MFS transporter, DHA1 family, multidrug resistance protein
LRDTSERFFIVLVLVYFTYAWMAATVSLPILSDISATLHVPLRQIRVALSYYMFAFAASQLVWGTISDRFGRKNLVMLSLLITVLGTLIAGFSNHYTSYVISRVIEGVGAGAAPPLMRSMYTDRFSGKRLAATLSLISISFAISPTASAWLASYVSVWFGWHGVYYAMVMLGVILMGVLFIFLPETVKEKTSKLSIKTVARHYVACLKNKRFLAGIISFALTGGSVVGGYLVVAPILFLQDLGLSKTWYGYVILLTSVMYVLGALNARRMLKIYSFKKIYTLSLSTAMCATALMAVMYCVLGLSYWSILLPMTLYTFAASSLTSIANATAMSAADHDKRGTAASLTGCSFSAAVSVMTAILALFTMQTLWPLIVTFFVCIVLCFITMILWLSPDPEIALIRH